MDLAVYKIIHLFGLILLFQSLGATLYAHNSGVEHGTGGSRKMLMAMHGIGVFFLLLGGFGMLARLEIGFPFPAWTWIKLVLWLVLGASPIIVKKKPSLSKSWWTLAFAFGLIAAYMGLFKPL